MYIEANTNIRILKNVPLDTTYEHTIYFSSATAQANYFISKQKYNLTHYSYQRYAKGKARVGINADNLYDCNYMMFKNNNFGDKWFYAYITNVEYVNNETSTITYELDVMQTWFFEHDVDYCFVEREHTSTDVIGEHIEPESVELGEYVFNSYSSLFTLSDLRVIIAIVDTSGQTVSGRLYDGIYGGAQLYAYEANDVDGINAKLGEYVQAFDSIISMYMCPASMIKNVGQDHLISQSNSSKDLTYTADAISSSSSLNGYTPKNKKLYTYPYSFYHVDDSNGNSIAFRYEFFSNLTPQFNVTGSITQPVQVQLRPIHYKGVSGGSGAGATLKTETLTLGNFPMCSWNADSYKAWVAQNSIPLANTLGASALGIAGGVAFGSVAAPIGIIAGVTLAGKTLMEGYKASIQADISKGSTNNGTVNSASQQNRFYGGRCSITRQYARMIDEYFTKYGYAVKRLKKPNRNVRPHWTFTKTIGATITGSVPCDDMKKICNIYDNGITFWKNGSEVGNYSLNNSV